MSIQQLLITLIQPEIVWEDPAANLEHYSRLIAGIREGKQVVVLPEMFSTGFSMAAERLAEPMNGRSVNWMADMAVKHRCILSGSLIIEEDGHYYNRMLWVQPDGNIGIYDKRHLFGYAQEHEHFTAGGKRQIVSVNGWKINLQICYDLRFPVWARNQGAEYDILLYVANWPQRRNLAWKTLLQARAIENQCFVVGVNRVGTDGKGYDYSGDSSVFGPMGETIWQYSGGEIVKTIALEREMLEQNRNTFPFQNDADKFMLL